MINVGIIGGAGYVGGELIRVLVGHPHCRLSFIHSESQASKPVSSVHRDLIGQLDISFTMEVDPHIDVLFLCAGHGRSRTFLEEYQFGEDTCIIDLSSDFRLAKDAEDFTYGLTELNRPELISNNRISNPGCFATCIQLGLLPLASSKSMKDDIHVTAITGSTGAGQKPMATTHFSWRNNNISVYKPFVHQHLDEINQSIRQVHPLYSGSVNFIPMRGNFSRGIFANLYTRIESALDDIKEAYFSFYGASPFVHITDHPLSVKDSVNTNNALIYIDKHDDFCRIECTIDNLIKGAAGQAVQNMNVSLGLDETSGLRLKPSAF